METKCFKNYRSREISLAPNYRKISGNWYNYRNKVWITRGQGRLVVNKEGLGMRNSWFITQVHHLSPYKYEEVIWLLHALVSYSVWGDYSTFLIVLLQRLNNLLWGNPLEEYLINISFNYKTYGYNGITNIFSHFETIKNYRKVERSNYESYENKLASWFPILNILVYSFLYL